MLSSGVFSVAPTAYLRVSSSFLFLFVVIIAALSERSLLMVPLLAAASTLAHWLGGKIAGTPFDKLAMRVSGQPVRMPTAGLARFGFFAGLVGYSLVYMVFVFFGALAGPIELSRSLSGFDGMLVLVPTGVTLLLALVRRALPKPDFPVDQQHANPGDGTIIDGEIIDAPHSDR
ncbi:MAG: hypothetical protein AAFO63_05990 [Pseudomonadota bacterium]